jgi:hypothetical protein
MPRKNLQRLPDEVKEEEEVGEEEEETVDQAECRSGRRRPWRRKRRNNGDFDVDGHLVVIGNGLELEWMKQLERRGGHTSHWNDQQRRKRRRRKREEDGVGQGQWRRNVPGPRVDLN